jgi:hypothetical protein
MEVSWKFHGSFECFQVSKFPSFMEVSKCRKLTLNSPTTPTTRPVAHSASRTTEHSCRSSTSRAIVRSSGRTKAARGPVTGPVTGGGRWCKREDVSSHKVCSRRCCLFFANLRAVLVVVVVLAVVLVVLMVLVVLVVLVVAVVATRLSINGCSSFRNSNQSECTNASRTVLCSMWKRVSILDGGGEGEESEGYLPNNFRRCHQARRRRCLATMVHGMRNGLVQPTDTNGGHV